MEGSPKILLFSAVIPYSFWKMDTLILNFFSHFFGASAFLEA